MTTSGNSKLEPEVKEMTLAEAIRLKNKIRPLITHEGWKYVKTVLAFQATVRLNGLIAVPVKGIDDTLRQEYEKGEIAMLNMLQELPKSLHGYFDDFIKEENRRQADAARTDTDADRPAAS